MSKCARPGCLKPAKSSCSGCGREYYCCSSCQKLDWKIHKSICPILKKLPNKLQPFCVVVQIIKEIGSTERNHIRILEHLLLYAEYQFGKEIKGLGGYRKREDGDRISHWTVEIEIFHYIYSLLSHYYGLDHSLSTIISDNMKFPYLQRSRSLLTPWFINLDSDAGNRIDKPDLNQIKSLLHALFYTEYNIASIAIHRRQFEIAEGHCQQCLVYSRRFALEGEEEMSMKFRVEKTTLLFHASKINCRLRERQGNLKDAVCFAEEGYNLVVEAYDCVHPQVQEAAGILINILIEKGDLFDAERYAQVTYSNLRDKKNGIDQESEEVAKGAYNLSIVIHRQNGDLKKAEELARESLRIGTLIYGGNHTNVGLSCDLLANILREQMKLGDETKVLYARYIAISIRNDGSDGANTATGNFNIANFYRVLALIQPTVDSKQAKLILAKSHFVESLRIYTKIYGSTHPKSLDAASALAIVLSDISRM